MQAPDQGGKPDGQGLVGLIRNPRSHRNKGRAAELAEDPQVLIATPRTHAALREVLAGFAARGIRYLAVDGGDGTVRDVLTCGAELFGDAWPEMIILPKGKTNALTVDLGLPQGWTLPQALAAASAGRRAQRRPLRVRAADGTGETLQGFILGAGAFTLATEAGQSAHKLGAFNSLAVGLTIAWGVLQSLFGRAGNPWRATTPMRFVDAETGAGLPHAFPEAADSRYVLVATTFENFPLGVRPFGPGNPPGLKLGLIDRPLRWIVALLPGILVGFLPGMVARRGVHRIVARAVGSGALDMEIGGRFIVDGEQYPPGRYRLDEGPLLTFVTP